MDNQLNVSSSTYLQQLRECPSCEGKSANKYMVNIYELTETKTNPDGSVTNVYKVGERCPVCGYEEISQLSYTTFVSNEYREYRTTNTEFIDKVTRMRELQKKYFKTRNKDILIQSREAEKEVDNWINNQETLF